MTQEGQTALWEETKEIPPKCCGVCRYCAELKTPYERSDGAVIFGYCFSEGDKDYSPNMGKGLAIFLPLDCGAGCKKFKKRRTET